jgi:ABC-type cobalamin/Fe3+-siderophores transport system ATPase subunit
MLSLQMGDPLLRLEGVGRAYRRGRQRWRVLVDVSLTVAAGEVVGVLGGRGEGKTTLLEVAAGIAPAEAGRVVFEGVDLTSCSAEERAELLGDRIAWLPREGMGDFDVLGYVGLPLAMGRGMRTRDADDRATQALRRVGAVECVERGWDELSDWERLLVTLARGIVSRPGLMVRDDLLDGLGAGGTREAGELLLSLARELRCGVLLSASDLESLLVADRVVCFDGVGGLTAMSKQTPTNIIELDDSRRLAAGR